MAGDRSAALIVRAAHSGALDFARVDPLNPRHRLRVALAAEECARRDAATVQAMQHSRALALLVAAAALKSGDAVQAMAEESERRIAAVRSILFPYLGEPEPAADAWRRDPRGIWESVFGSLADPEVAAGVDALAAWLADGG